MSSTEGFADGDLIVINPGGTNQEDNQLTSLEPCTLATPLQFDHEAGEAVLKVVAAPTPTPTRAPGGLPETGTQPAAPGSGMPWTFLVIGALIIASGGLVLAHERRRTR